MVCFGLLVFMVCQQPAAAPTGQARFCKTYQPVTWSRRDTPETVTQVKRMNAKWRVLCAPKAAK